MKQITINNKFYDINEKLYDKLKVFKHTDNIKLQFELTNEIKLLNYWAKNDFYGNLGDCIGNRNIIKFIDLAEALEFEEMEKIMYKRLAKCSVFQLETEFYQRLSNHYIDKLNKYLPEQKLIMYDRRLSKLGKNPTQYEFLNPLFDLDGPYTIDFLMEFKQEFEHNYEYYPCAYDMDFYNYLVSIIPTHLDNLIICNDFQISKVEKINPDGTMLCNGMVSCDFNYKIMWYDYFNHTLKNPEKSKFSYVFDRIDDF